MPAVPAPRRLKQDLCVSGQPGLHSKTILNKTTDRKITIKPVHKAEALEERAKMAHENQMTGAVTDNDLINSKEWLS